MTLSFQRPPVTGFNYRLLIEEETGESASAASCGLVVRLAPRAIACLSLFRFFWLLLS
jgi:hypothetical protein